MASALVGLEARARHPRIASIEDIEDEDNAGHHDLLDSTTRLSIVRPSSDPSCVVEAVSSNHQLQPEAIFAFSASSKRQEIALHCPVD